jgi:hypothetical protein
MASDDELLADLAAVLHGPGSPSDAARAAAYDAIGLRSLEHELAALVEDTLLAAPSAAVRGERERVVTFRAPSLVIEVRVDTRGRTRRLVGQLDPPDALQLEVVVGDRSTAAAADERGRFVVEGLPSGPLQVRVSSPSVRTSWLRI